MIAALSQSILLIGRVRRPWLWIVAGLVAFLIQNIVKFPLFELAMAFPAAYKHLLFYSLGILGAGFAVSITQAFVLRHWRLDGVSWFLVSFGAVLLGLIAHVIVDQIVTSFMIERSVTREVTRGVLKMLSLWMTFGAITGWVLWHRLNSEKTAISIPA